MVIIGDDEIKNNTISIRARDGEQKNGMPTEAFIDKIVSEKTSRSKNLDLVQLGQNGAEGGI